MMIIHSLTHNFINRRPYTKYIRTQRHKTRYSKTGRRSTTQRTPLIQQIEKKQSTNDGPMAQLVARTTPDRKVVRSSRAGLIIFFAFFLTLIAPHTQPSSWWWGSDGYVCML
ncbi:hypothetical protein An02g10820 [Aspergillus niger]|uniref:Uncharacterized protein n=2 Tax=Aspergillus niger TaxID=5061 RepID=A2QEE8_ASPNC|nr:hypothetical protein An02g10820 [Aspergillus niger]CAK48747.1 hypothetical protein An02g10820 [Aspergillus niger]